MPCPFSSKAAHWDRPTVSDFRHNEYAVSSLVEHALGEGRLN